MTTKPENKDALIAEQQLEIRELKLRLSSHAEVFQHIYNSLYNVGAPLNDNCLQFNSEQRRYLSNCIADECNSVNWGKKEQEYD